MQHRSGSYPKSANSAVVLGVVLFLASPIALTQTPSGANEFWPAVKASVELKPRTRIQLFAETENSEDSPDLQWKAGALLTYRMKQILKPHQTDIDDENEHNLVVAVGYEYVQTTQSDNTKRENRIIIQATPRHIPGAGLLLQDRNRVELRWVNGNFSARYRNKLTVQRGFNADRFRFTPYASGELFFDGNHHSWNQNQYAFGVQLPFKRRLMVDTYYLRQNCTTCSQDPLNVWGLTLNLYFRSKK
jgi:hypothetical protein